MAVIEGRDRSPADEQIFWLDFHHTRGIEVEEKPGGKSEHSRGVLSSLFHPFA